MSKPRYELTNVSYSMQIGMGTDVWRILGTREDGEVWISFPIDFDLLAGQIETANSIYEIKSWNPNSKYIKEDFWQQLSSDMENGGFEVH